MSGTEDDYNQTRYLDAAKKVVKEQAFYMKRSMDGDKLEVAFEHAIEMLRELKTDLLSPKSYYELYMKVQEELRELEDYLSTLQRAGRNISEDYENVQSCVHVLPRLYLLFSQECVQNIFTLKELDIFPVELIRSIIIMYIDIITVYDSLPKYIIMLQYINSTSYFAHILYS